MPCYRFALQLAGDKLQLTRPTFLRHAESRFQIAVLHDNRRRRSGVCGLGVENNWRTARGRRGYDGNQRNRSLADKRQLKAIKFIGSIPILLGSVAISFRLELQYLESRPIAQEWNSHSSVFLPHYEHSLYLGQMVSNKTGGSSHIMRGWHAAGMGFYRQQLSTVHRVQGYSYLHHSHGISAFYKCKQPTSATPGHGV